MSMVCLHVLLPARMVGKHMLLQMRCLYERGVLVLA